MENFARSENNKAPSVIVQQLFRILGPFHAILGNIRTKIKGN